MVQKEKPKYKGTPDSDVYVVWVDGVWKIYRSLTQADVQYLKALDENKPAQFLRYELAEVIGKNDPTPNKAK